MWGSMLKLGAAGPRCPGFTRAPRRLLSPPSPALFSRPFWPLLQSPPLAKLLSRPGCSGRKVGARDRPEEGAQPGGSEAPPVWTRCSPCSTRRTHFPRWLGSAAESVGLRVTGASWRLPPARRGNHSTVKDTLLPSPVVRDEMCSAQGEAAHFAPVRERAPGQCAPEQRADAADAEVFVQLYGVETGSTQRLCPRGCLKFAKF